MDSESAALTIGHRMAALLLVPLAALACADAAQARPLDELEPCTLTAPGGGASLEARCGGLEVAENPEAPGGRRIELRYAVLPARVATPRADGVVYLAGGPGQAATEVWPLLHPALEALNRERHILLLDQRGTGGSHPLDCDFSGLDPFARFDADGLAALLRDCLAQIEVDPRFYTSGEAVADLEALRAHLGLEQLNLIAGSYGTRLAQLYLRRHPQRVRSLVLDGVVPMGLPLGSEHAPVLEQALEEILAGCAAEKACAERFPELDRALATLRERYRESPEMVTVEDPRTGEPRELEFNDSTLALAIRFLAYAPQTQALLPVLIHEAAHSRNPRRLASQALMVVDDMNGQLARGLELSVLCSEDQPYYPDGLDYGDTLLGNVMLDYAHTACDVWPSRDTGDDLREPVADAVPALLLSGERDPVTPPTYGEQVARHLPNSRHLVLNGQGHIVLRSRCTGQIATAFIEQASTEGLDFDCIERLRPEPYFLDLLGPRQ